MNVFNLFSGLNLFIPLLSNTLYVLVCWLVFKARHDFSWYVSHIVSSLGIYTEKLKYMCTYCTNCIVYTLIV